MRVVLCACLFVAAVFAAPLRNAGAETTTTQTTMSLSTTKMHDIAHGLSVCYIRLLSRTRDSILTHTLIIHHRTSHSMVRANLLEGDNMPKSPEPFFADEEPNWEPYAENEKEAEALESEFDEEYQRYLDEMAEAMMNDKNLRAEVIKELNAIGSEEELSKEDTELLKIAHRFEEEDLRTELEEQERQMGKRGDVSRN